MLIYLIAVPLVAAFTTMLFSKKVQRVGEIASCASGCVTFIVSIFIARQAMPGAMLAWKTVPWMKGISTPLIVDGLSAFLLVLVNLLGLLIMIYSSGYMSVHTGRWKYYTLMLIALAGANGVLITGDLFTLFVFLEVASIAVYALVAFSTEAEACEASFKYAVMGSVAASFMLLAIAVLYIHASTFDMADIATINSMTPAGTHVIQFAAVLFFMALGLKSALVPFHTWMADAYTKAPATVASLSSGIMLKVLGIYAFVRILFNVLGMQTALAPLMFTCAALSMLVGGIMAFGQTHIRRFLAYSGISQIGFIVLGIATGSALGIIGSVLHIINHSAAKVLLFMNAGEMERHFKSDVLSDMRDVMRKMPVVGSTNLIAMMSVCGVPPAIGFWSKLIIILACLKTGHVVMAGFAVIASALTLIYYFRDFTPVIFESVPGEIKSVCTRVPFSTALPVIILATICLFGGVLLLPGPGNLFLKQAGMIISDSAAYAQHVMGALR